MAAQLCEPLAADEWIWIGHRRHNAADACCDDAARTRTGTAVMATRLERHEQRRAAGLRAGVLQGKDFGVRLAGPPESGDMDFDYPMNLGPR